MWWRWQPQGIALQTYNHQFLGYRIRPAHHISDKWVPPPPIPHPRPLLTYWMWNLVGDLSYSDHLHYYLLCHCVLFLGTRNGQRFEGEIVKDQDCMKGGNPSIFKNVSYATQTVLENTDNPSQVSLMLLKSSLKCILGTMGCSSDVSHPCGVSVWRIL